MAKGDAWLDEKVTLESFKATRTKISNALMKTRREWFELFAPYADSGGVLRDLMGTDGKAQVTEVNLANQLYEGNPTFEAYAQKTAQYTRRIVAVLVQASAGGELVAAALVPAVAGLKSCMNLTAIWSDMTDASVSLTITTSSGLSNGPAVLVVATTANQVAPNFYNGIPYKGSAVNEAITVAAAAGQAQANQLFIFIGEFWYEAS